MPKLIRRLPDVPVTDDGPPVFECVHCGHRFDMEKAFQPRFDALECPDCHAMHDREGPHWVLNPKTGNRKKALPNDAQLGITQGQYRECFCNSCGKRFVGWYRLRPHALYRYRFGECPKEASDADA